MLVEAKSNLAKLMASENLFVEQRNVETAYFDLKSRILTIPVLNGKLSPELYDLLLGHEVGHALETPEKGWHDSIIDLGVNKSILNVCEDARIEKKIKRKFPGIRISFVKGYKELTEMDFFGIKDKDLNKLNLIDRINLHTKCGATLGIEFGAEETVLLHEVETTETFEEVVIVAKKIQDLMKADLDKKKEQQEQGKEKKKLTIIIEKGGKESGQGNQEELNIDEYDEVEVIEVDASEEGDGEESKETTTSSGQEGSTESDTDKSFRKREKELFSEEAGKNLIYNNIPEVDLENIIVPYKKVYSTIKSCNSNAVIDIAKMKQEFNKFRLESNKVVSYLVKEFEMRKNAEQQARVQVAKTGELNMNKLYDYKFTDDIFRRMSKVPNGKSHGLVMYIDWSGSMGDYINSTVKQLLNLSMFCRKVNIPFEVYAFSSHAKTVCEYPKDWKYKPKYDIQKPKTGDLVIGHFSLLNLLSSKMNNNDFTEAASFLLNYGTASGAKRYCTDYYPPDFFTLSGTPLNEAIVAAFQMVPKFKDENKLEIVNAVFLTDGEGSPLSQRFGHQNMKGEHALEYGATPTNYNRAFLRDPVTRATIEMDIKMVNRSMSALQTEPLLQLLKQRLECNLIGFFVCNTRDARSSLNGLSNKPKSIDRSLDEFRKDGHTLVKDCGYDEYYFLRAESLDTDDNEFEVTSNSTRSLVSSFSKYTGGKVGSRVVLNRFINLIT